MTSGSYRVQVIVDLLKKHEIENIIFSPGSRNAPLVIGFNGDEYFQTKSLVDEKCCILCFRNGTTDSKTCSTLFYIRIQY